jgi:hypothetical protein
MGVQGSFSLRVAVVAFAGAFVGEAATGFAGGGRLAGRTVGGAVTGTTGVAANGAAADGGFGTVDGGIRVWGKRV